MGNDNSPNELLNAWQSQELGVLAVSVDELRRASDKLARRVFWRNTTEYLAAIVVVVGYGYWFFTFHTLLLRLGSVLTVAGVLWVVYQLHKRGSATPMKMEMDPRSCLDFHRSELVRQRDLHASAWRWYLLPFVPGLGTFMFGQLQLQLARTHSASQRHSIAVGFTVVGGIIACVFLAIWKLNQLRARSLQKKIDELDAMKEPLEVVKPEGFPPMG